MLNEILIAAVSPEGSALVRLEGIYIGLLLIACLIGIAVKFITHLPYTIALVLFGLGIALTGLGPDPTETGFSKEMIFFVVLPPLLFQASLHLDFGKLLGHVWPIILFATIGVLISTFGIGLAMRYLGGIESLLVALLFGAMMAPTDPVSVIALFKEVGAPSDLKYLVEGESLFNDGTGVVVFSIILGLITGKHGDSFGLATAMIEFAKVVAGGFFFGAIFGWMTYQLLKRLNDHLLENALCLVLAFGSFWVAESVHVSGVIAVVVAGLFIGNTGRSLAMNEKTKETVETFFESIDFLINSLLFLLIGIELKLIGLSELQLYAVPLMVAIGALVLSRAIAVYPLFYTTRGLGTNRPGKWSHVLFWGGLRGSIPIALYLGLPHNELLDTYRPLILVAAFGTVFFSLVIQGITMKPLLVGLGLRMTPDLDETEGSNI